jgi:hypothetical protein
MPPREQHAGMPSQPMAYSPRTAIASKQVIPVQHRRAEELRFRPEMVAIARGDDWIY